MTTPQREALYERFLVLERQGLRRQARQALGAFLQSFATFEDRACWTWTHLHTLPANPHSRIRHEIYEQVVFPVLKAGDEAADPESRFWLAQTIQNLYSARGLYEQIGFRTPEELLREACAANPERQAYRAALLACLLATFDYLDHEWPAGILLDAPPESGKWQRLEEDIALARSLDDDERHQARLAQFQDRVTRHRARLSNTKPD